MGNRQIRRGMMAICAAGFATIGAKADTRVFTKIADQSTAIPNGTGTYSTFSQPQVSLGNIVFAGANAAGQPGIYHFNPVGGGLTTVIDSATSLPGPAGNTPSLAGPSSIGLSVFGNDISFMANLAGGGELLTTRNGLHDAVDPTTAGGQPIGAFSQSSIDAQNIYFHTSENSLAPVHLIGVYGKVAADNSVTVSPQQNDVFHFLARGGSGPAYSSNNGLVTGTAGPPIVFTSAGAFSFTSSKPGGPAASFLLPGDASGPVNPGGSGNPIFSDDGNAAVIYAASASQQGLYSKAQGGALTTVATNGTIIPTFDGVTQFGRFTNVTIDNGNIAFIGGPSAGPLGIFAASNGLISEIASVGDTVDGKTISGLSFSDDRPLSGNELVFTANFSDGSTGLYLANVPEPSMMALMSLGALGLVRRARRQV